jgi:hypothetical protein
MSPFLQTWIENVDSKEHTSIIESLRNTISAAGVGGAFECFCSSHVRDHIISSLLSTVSGRKWSDNFKWSFNDASSTGNSLTYGNQLRQKLDTTLIGSLKPNVFYDCFPNQDSIDSIA